VIVCVHVIVCVYVCVRVCVYGSNRNTFIVELRSSMRAYVLTCVCTCIHEFVCVRASVCGRYACAFITQELVCSECVCASVCSSSNRSWCA